MRGASGDQPPQATGCHMLGSLRETATTCGAPQANENCRASGKHLPQASGHQAWDTTGKQPPQANGSCMHSHLHPCAPQRCRKSVKSAVSASPKEGFFSFHTCKAGLGVSRARVAKPRGCLPLPGCRATTRPATGSPHK